MTDRRTLARAGGAGAFAAFLWAAYYVFVLVLPGRADLLVLVVPFLVAAAAFLLPRPGDRRGGAIPLLRLTATPGGVARGCMLLAVQVDVIVGTRWVGAVDTSLATLLADVVATPLLVFAFYRADAAKVRSVGFWLGVVVAASGASLAILGGGGTRPLTLESVLVLAPLPVLIAVYFVAVNQACKVAPPADVLGSAGLVAGLFGAVIGVGVLGVGSLTVPLDLAGWLLLVVIGITAFYLAPWAYFWAAGRTTIVIPAVLQSLIPVFTLLLVVLLGLQESSYLGWVGVPVAFFGSVLALYEKPTRSGPP